MIGKNTGKAALLLLLVLSASACGRGVTVPEEIKVGVERDSERPKQERKAEPDAEEETTAHSISEEKYAYGTLDDQTKTVYDQILSCILDHREEVTVDTLEPEVIEKAYDAMSSDYGGLFWINGYIYTKYSEGDEVTKLTFTPKYTMDLQNRQDNQKRVDEAVEKILADISISDSDYEKSKYVYETLIHLADYDMEAPNNQNILSVFLGKATVCQGYSCATQYLLTELGIDSVIISGEVSGESHAWVAAKLDDAWYYIDTTFGNSLYSGNEEGGMKYVNYAWLNITEEELLTNHETTWNFPLPECDATRDNYFVQEGLYFTDFDVERLGEKLTDAWTGGNQVNGGVISWKFSEPELYDQVFEYFLTEKHIADWCEGLVTYHYVDDENKSVLMIGF